jgi:uridylate kinase
MSNEYKYQRVLIKFSGESLSGQGETGYATEAIKSVVERVEKVVDSGVEVALVVGAGNIWRGVNGSDWGMDRVSADYMGMLATVMNALCLRDAFDSAGIAAEVFTSIPMKPVAEPFDRRQAIKAMESGKVVIFAGGTGSPFFTTDTTATLRALETNCEAVLKATKVDGVYTDDPFKNPNATRYETLSFADALSQRLAIMDSTAFSMCRDNSLPIIVFNFSEEDGLDMVLRGDTTIATLIS